MMCVLLFGWEENKSVFIVFNWSEWGLREQSKSQKAPCKGDTITRRTQSWRHRRMGDLLMVAYGVQHEHKAQAISILKGGF